MHGIINSSLDHRIHCHNIHCVIYSSVNRCIHYQNGLPRTTLYNSARSEQSNTIHELIQIAFWLRRLHLTSPPFPEVANWYCNYCHEKQQTLTTFASHNHYLVIIRNTSQSLVMHFWWCTISIITWKHILVKPIDCQNTYSNGVNALNIKHYQETGNLLIQTVWSRNKQGQWGTSREVAKISCHPLQCYCDYATKWKSYMNVYINSCLNILKRPDTDADTDTDAKHIFHLTGMLWLSKKIFWLCTRCKIIRDWN